jgi:hypothetical protein
MYLVPTFHHLIRSFTGVSDSKKFNAGHIEYRSKHSGNQSATSPLSFNNNWKPEERVYSLHQLRLHHLVHYPIFYAMPSSLSLLAKKVIKMDLANNSYIWQNRFFYDYSFRFQISIVFRIRTRLFLRK